MTAGATVQTTDGDSSLNLRADDFVRFYRRWARQRAATLRPDD